MQAAKEANIEPLRLVTSCMAASVCLRYHHILKAQDSASHDAHSDDHKEDVTNHHDDSKDAHDYNNSPYSAYHGSHDHHNGHFSGSKNGYYNHHNGHHSNSHHNNQHNNNHWGQNHHHHTHHDDHYRRKRRKRKKRKSRSRCYLVADLSNIGCSLSIIECKQKRHSDIVKVHFCSGSTNDGLWRMINAFSLFVVRSFVDGYNGYYRPHHLVEPASSSSDHDHYNQSSNGYSNEFDLDSASNGHLDRDQDHNRNGHHHHHDQYSGNNRGRKRMAFYDSISRYDYKHDMFVYDELHRIESIETTVSDDPIHRSSIHQDADTEEMDRGLPSSMDHNELSLNNEALKCRFRSQMLCDTIIEHLHDQYRNEEVQIHYERFYRSFSLQLILTAQKLQEIALDPFLFSLTHCIDKILQEYCKYSTNNTRIDECVLVGDGGNIPAVESLFGEYFEMNGDSEMQSATVVSRGCAVAAAIDIEMIPSPICLDLLPHSIRMEDATNNDTDTNTVVIAAQNPCPCKKTVKRYTYSKDQTTYSMLFYEGESNNNGLCELIGRFEIRNIQKRNKTQIVIVVHVDRNGIMMVSAEDVSAKPPVPLTVVKLSH